MKKVLTTKAGKRILVDTLEIPNYEALYNDENGNPFVKEPEIVVVKAAPAKKIAKKAPAKKKTVKKAVKKTK